MKLRLFYTIRVLALTMPVQGQHSQISGLVTDSELGHPITGNTVLLKESKQELLPLLMKIMH